MSIMNRSVVLVQPDRRTALALEDAVTRAGSRVIARATHLEDAVRKVVALRPDVAIVDAAIPGDGVALGHAIRQSRHTAIVIVTDENVEAVRERADRWCVSVDATAAELAVTIELACRDRLTGPADAAMDPQ